MGVWFSCALGDSAVGPHASVETRLSGANSGHLVANVGNELVLKSVTKLAACGLACALSAMFPLSLGDGLVFRFGFLAEETA